MRLRAKKYLLDIQAAADLIGSFTAGKNFTEYSNDPLLRSGVERQFEIIGEALRKLFELDARLAARIPEHRKIIAFRNVLIHGYATVDSRLVWGIVEGKLRDLRLRVKRLLEAGTAKASAPARGPKVVRKART
jgi:uncharacterized protein with HEPN domain